MTRWQLQTAKNRLSEVVRRAAAEGPQVITVHGKDAVVVVHAAEFRKLSKRSRSGLVGFLRRSPLRAARLDLTRDRDPGRKVDL